MRRIFTTMQVTIDGKTVRPDGTIDWVGDEPDPDVYDFEAFDRADVCVLGRVMYPEYEEYWRSVAAGADDTPEAKRYAEFADRTPHYVLTRTMTDFDWPVARPASDISEIAALRDQPGGDIYVVGGATTVRSFINAGLLDELRLTVHPMLVGEGASLFDGISGDHNYQITDIARLADGSTRVVYQARVS
jgi:dihydrofolate reductase